eukprot:4038343-Amphidinium_carterae.1
MIITSPSQHDYIVEFQGIGSLRAKKSSWKLLTNCGSNGFDASGMLDHFGLHLAVSLRKVLRALVA